MNQKYCNDQLGTRMKMYEGVSKIHLMRRTPVIIRIDGKAFHTFTRRLKDFDTSLEVNPFSEAMHDVMSMTTHALCANTQNAVIGYTQSDEISIFLRDWDTLTTDQWFGGCVQKIASVTASMATAFFNFYYSKYEKIECVGQLPLFDARVFNLPKEEVANYFVWRQNDATRNSVNMLARFYFSHKELQGKSVSVVQDMLIIERGVNWNDIDIWKKRGTAVIPNPNNVSSATPWFIDKNMPILTQEREYITRHLEVEDE